MMATGSLIAKFFIRKAYYAAFFSIRAPGFDYELMCLGQDKLLYHMRITRNGGHLSKKEQDNVPRDEGCAGDVCAWL